MQLTRNNVQLIGFIGSKPVSYTYKDFKVARISLATNFSIKEGENWVQKTEWHRIVIKDPELITQVETFEKGQRICVEGRLKTRTYEKDGITRSITEIIVNMLMLFSNVEKSINVVEEKIPTGTVSSDPISSFDEDVPF